MTNVFHSHLGGVFLLSVVLIGGAAWAWFGPQR
jgi:hypothetical protein